MASTCMPPIHLPGQPSDTVASAEHLLDRTTHEQHERKEIRKCCFPGILTQATCMYGCVSMCIHSNVCAQAKKCRSMSMVLIDGLHIFYFCVSQASFEI